MEGEGLSTRTLRYTGVMSVFVYYSDDDLTPVCLSV